MDKIEKVVKIVGHEKDVETICEFLRHAEYLGNVGASRNLILRVYGDGSGRIKVYNEDGTRIHADRKYNTEQGSNAVVGVYDIG
jgi:hypothetical protein